MNKDLIMGIFGILVVVILIGGGAYLYNASVDQATSTPSGVVTTPPPTPTVSQAKIPTVSTDGTHTVVSNAGALVTGKVTPNGAQTSYWYEYGKTNALGTQTSPQSVGSGWIAIPTPAYIAGLSATTAYYFRLSAQNAFGKVSGETFTFATNTTPPPPGTLPTVSTDAATDVSRTTADLNARVNPNNASTLYWVEYGEGDDLGRITPLQAVGSGNTSLAASVSLSDLKPLTKYCFRVNSQNAYGTVNGSIKNFTTTGPAAAGIPKTDTTHAPTIARSSPKFNAQVNPNGAATGYWFEYGVDAQLDTIMDSTTKANIAGTGTADVAVSTNVTGLTRNTRYYYRVIAENIHGLTRGDIVTFKTNN